MSRLPYGSPWGQNVGPLDYSGEESATLSRFFNNVYAWMCAGLGLTAVVAFLVASNPTLIPTSLPVAIILLIVEIGLVMAISGAINRISAGAATALFMLYAGINGFVLSVLFYEFARATLASAFIITAGTFGAMSIFGMVTKRDLTAMGRALQMLLVGLVIACVVSLFYHPSTMVVIINYLGVIVFTGLTAYDTQRLKQIGYATVNDPRLSARMAIVGSLVLYLDFINLFLFLVQILGNNSRRN